MTMSRDRNDTAVVERIILIKWCRDNQIRTDVLLKIDFSCSTTELYLYPVPMESSNKFPPSVTRYAQRLLYQICALLHA